MKKVYIFYIIIFCSFISCTDESNPSNSETYVPQITNQWFEKGKPDHIFQLTNKDPNKNHGFLDGFEEYPDSNIFNTPLIGVFTDRHIEFNVYRFNDTINFSGTFIQDTVIQLTSKYGPLTIIHN